MFSKKSWLLTFNISQCDVNVQMHVRLSWIICPCLRWSVLLCRYYEAIQANLCYFAPPPLQFRRPLSPRLSPPISLYFYLSFSTYLPISSQRFFQYVLMNFIVYALQVTFYSSWCYVPEYAHWSPRLVNCVSVQPGYAYTLFTVKKQYTWAVKPDLCYVDEQGK